MAAYFLHSDVLFHHAKAAFECTSAAKSENAPNQNDALTAILFSAVSLEAWINEIPAQVYNLSLNSIPRISTFAQVIADAEAWRVPVRIKYQLAKTILTGQSYNKGTSPYLDFDLLFRTRDALVHMKPEKIPPDLAAKWLKLDTIPEMETSDKTRTEKLVNKLASRGLCVKETLIAVPSWISSISTRAAARWSCNVVADMVKSICDALCTHVKDPSPRDALLSSFQRIEES